MLPTFLALVFSIPVLGPLVLMVSLAIDGRGPVGWGNVVGAVLGVTIWYGGVLTLAWFMLRRHDFVRSLTVERSSGEVVIAREFLWFRREHRLPVSSIEQIEIESSMRTWDDALGVPSRVCWRLGGGRSRCTHLSAPFMEDDAHLGFLRALAAVTGLKGVRVERDDSLGYRAVATDALGEGTTPIDANEPVGAPDVLRFRSPSRIATWSPGREVRFERPMQTEVLGMEIVAILFFLLVAFVFLLSASETQGWKRGLFATLGLGITAASGWAIWSGLHELLPRRCILDWGERAIRVEALFGDRMEFAEISSLEVREESQVVRVKRRPKRTLHRARLFARSKPPGVGESRELLLVETEWSRLGPSGPREEATRIARPIAESLGVPVEGGA